MDIKGSEYAMLFATSPETLSRVEALSLEDHDHLVEHHGIAMAKFLTSRGFDVELNPRET